MRALDSIKTCFKPQNYDEIFSSAGSYEVASNPESLVHRQDIWYTPSSTSFEQLSIVSRDDFAEGRINVDLFEISNELRNKMVGRILEKEPEQFPRPKKKTSGLPYSKKTTKTKQPPLVSSSWVKGGRRASESDVELELWSYADSLNESSDSRPVPSTKRPIEPKGIQECRKSIFRFMGLKYGKRKGSREKNNKVVVLPPIEETNPDEFDFRRSPSTKHIRVSYPSDDASEISYLVP